MCINLPAVGILVALALLSLGAIATSDTLWQQAETTSAAELCNTCGDGRVAS